MTFFFKRRYLTWIIVFLLTFAKSLATKSNQLIRAHVNKRNLSLTTCYGEEPISIPMEKIQKELDELYKIERNIHNEFTEKQSDDSDTSIKYFYIDVVAVADYFLYKKFSEDSLKLRTQIAHLFFAAKRIFLQNKFPMPGMFDFKIVINLVDIIIIETIEKSILNKVREGKNLTLLDKREGIAQLLDFASKIREDSYDHITLLTALDMIARNNKKRPPRDTAGVAVKDGMCNPMKSLSIIEEHGRGRTVLGLVHELGHNLGAGHDGVDNKCSPGYNLMSPGQNSYNKWKQLRNLDKWLFSECSRKEIASHIASLFNGGFVKDIKDIYDRAGLKLTKAKIIRVSQYLCDCFTKTIPIQKSVPDVSKTFQGLDHNISEQCIERGKELTDECTAKNPEDLPCVIRHCKGRIRGRESCLQTTPYRGTSCGKDKVCEAGYCRRIDELKNVKMSFSSRSTAPCCCYPRPKNSSRCLRDYGLNLVIVTLMVCGILI